MAAVDWNHYSDVMEGKGTTNNISESYNSSWTGSLSRRPTLYTILEHLTPAEYMKHLIGVLRE
jgi:hypothetical protein